ncbi:tyrosine phosphatase [Fusarium tricinctum]|uniref:Tyrosine phosphatase n=1 Tax=Fusarium tricinctum TaxID=61284 RepID=A0A8K0WAE6_9HYPO|nr:tyrosine phosphatase [Fusarium tricinctum]
MAPSTHVATAQLLKLAETDESTPIPAAGSATILSILPFLNNSGTFNMRDLRLVPGSPIRPGYAFRCGSLEGLEASGKATVIHTHRIKWIFDPRSTDKRTRSPDPDTIGIRNTGIPGSHNNSVDISDFINGGDEEGYYKIYIQLMEAYGPNFRTILEHIRDGAEEPFLFHYTDKHSAETIALDYILTQISSELILKLLPDHAIQETGCRGFEDSGFHNLCSLRRTSWNSFLKGLQSKYGGFEGYDIVGLGFLRRMLSRSRGI